MQPTLPGVEEAVTPSSSIVESTHWGTPSWPAVRPAAPVSHAGRGPVRQADAPYCYQCGVQMQRAGSCFACPSCGTTSGCS